MVRERVQRCLEVAAAYRASGHKAKEWATANDLPERVLASRCAHARRWQAPGNLQSHPRKSFVVNNPMFFTDPSGYDYGLKHGMVS